MGRAGRESGPQRHLDAQLAALAARQQGVVSLRQLIALGLSCQAVYRRARIGRLHRIHRGVYALVPPELLSYRGRYMAATLACGDGAVLSHRSAADLLGLRHTSRRGIDVTVPGRSIRSHDEVDIHRSTTLTAADATVADGIPCTSTARTLLDLGALVPQTATEGALNQADALRLLDVRALETQLARHPRHPGASRLRAALALHASGQGATESGLEDALVELIRAAGLPAPERQVWFTLDDGGDPVRADFVWRAQRVILETDSRKWHRTARAFEADRRKDQRLTRAGWRVVRVTDRQIETDPQSIIELLGALLR